MAISRIDQRLLARLQSDGRATYVELSAAAQLSAPQCLRRVKQLEASGVIRRYAAIADPQKLGMGVTAFVSLSIDRDKFAEVRSFEKSICRFAQVLECYTISGDFDYMLKVVARDLKDLSQFLTDGLMQIPGVAGVRSLICLEEIKPLSPIPVAGEAKRVGASV